MRRSQTWRHEVLCFKFQGDNHLQPGKPLNGKMAALEIPLSGKKAHKSHNLNQIKRLLRQLRIALDFLGVTCGLLSLLSLLHSISWLPWMSVEECKAQAIS